MYTDLHTHVSSLQVQDQIRAASTARFAREAKRVSAPARAPRFATRRRFLPTLRRVA